MTIPANTKVLADDFAELEAFLKQTRERIDGARQFIIDHNLDSVEFELASAARRYGMKRSTAENMAADYAATIAAIKLSLLNACDPLDDLAKHMGSARHIVNAIVHRSPNKPADSSMDLR